MCLFASRLRSQFAPISPSDPRLLLPPPEDLNPWQTPLLLLSLVLVCLGSPNRLLHHYLAALIGIAPLFYLIWDRPFWKQVRISFRIWFPFCVFVFFLDVYSVREVVTVWEVVGGVVVAPLLPLFYISATVLSLRLTRSCQTWIRPLAMAAVWTSLDGCLGLIKFPIPFHWGSLLFDWPLGIQIADITGIWGVTFFAILINASLAAVWKQGLRGSQGWGIAISTLAITASVLGYGRIQLQTYDDLCSQPGIQTYQVAAVQPVAWLEGDRSWAYRSQRYRALQDLTVEGIQAGADLILWPEGGVRARLRDTPLETYIIDPLIPHLTPGRQLIVGATEPDPRTLDLPDDQMKFINSALLYNAAGQVTERYGKQWIFFYFESARYIPSPEGYQPLQGGDTLGLLGLMICLESVLPGPSRALVQHGAQSLLVISDDSWFGNSNWPILHANLSIFRAIETRRSFVFVNNTGGNLVIDPSGRIQVAGAVFEPGVIVGTMLLQDRMTFYTWAGDWFSWLTIMILIRLIVTRPQPHH